MNAGLESLTRSESSPADLRGALARIAELEAELRRARHDVPVPPPAPLTEMRLLEVEGWLVKFAMDRAKGNVSRAARALGLSRAALYRRLDRHALRNLEAPIAAQ